MNNKILLIPLFILFLISFVIAVEFTLDKDSRILVVYDFLKGTVVSFKFESKIYILKMGDFDFENDRVTIQWVSPQRLGTNILNLNEYIEVDLDDDDENDIKITLTDLFEDMGINEDLVKGTARLKFEIFSEETVIETTTSTTTTIKENVSEKTAPQEITGSQVKEVAKLSDYKNWIIGGVIALVLVFILIIRKNIINFFKNILKKNKEEEEKESKEHMPCPSCGKDTIIGDKHCINCGTNLPGKPKFCTKCGERIRAESKFCASCGAEIKK